MVEKQRLRIEVGVSRANDGFDEVQTLCFHANRPSTELFSLANELNYAEILVEQRDTTADIVQFVDYAAKYIAGHLGIDFETETDVVYYEVTSNHRPHGSSRPPHAQHDRQIEYPLGPNYLNLM